jgi:hypothetical protein
VSATETRQAKRSPDKKRLFPGVEPIHHYHLLNTALPANRGRFVSISPKAVHYNKTWLPASVCPATADELPIPYKFSDIRDLLVIWLWLLT